MDLTQGTNNIYIKNLEKYDPKMAYNLKTTSYSLANLSFGRPFWLQDLIGISPIYSADYMQIFFQTHLAQSVYDHSEKVVLARELISKIIRNETINYNKVIIKGDMDLDYANLSKGENKLSIIDSQICISNSRIKGSLNFSNTYFNKSMNFSNTLFEDDVSFREAQFGKNVDFSGVQFSRYADFADAKFWSDANFLGGKFNRYADFSDAQFKEISVFNSAQFNEVANFKRAQFSRYTNFNSAKFNEDVLADIWFKLINIYYIFIYILVGMFIILLAFIFILCKKSSFELDTKTLYKKFNRIKLYLSKSLRGRPSGHKVSKSQFVASKSYEPDIYTPNEPDVYMHHKPGMSKQFR